MLYKKQINAIKSKFNLSDTEAKIVLYYHEGLRSEKKIAESLSMTIYELRRKTAVIKRLMNSENIYEAIHKTDLHLKKKKLLSRDIEEREMASINEWTRLHKPLSGKTGDNDDEK